MLLAPKQFPLFTSARKMRMDTSTLAPLSIVDDLFNKFVEAHPSSEEALSESADWGVPAHFDKLLGEGDMLQKV
jgi:hypothetical protein